ncbi:MAG: carboxymuconolactone decarboxylase family protein [Propionicimonas sp.]|uniref:carboxymuconolactone decarboxylase family protein n=1 Tax=Propionicimonas sp. TaxID=1955623 RepID=UPI003D095C80
MAEPTEPDTILTDQVDQARLARGAAVLAGIDGEAGQAVVDSLGSFAPRLANHIVAHAFGDVYAGTDLTPAQRQLVTIGALTALGGCEPQLAVHIGAGLNVGLTRAEIIEAITHAAVYAGFPRAINAANIAQQVFQARSAT